MEEYGSHYSVLYREILDFLSEEASLNDGGTFVDGTLGHAGHSLRILKSFPNINLISIDQDIRAIQNAEKLKSNLEKSEADRWVLVHSNFEDYFKNSGEMEKISSLKGALFDFGVSSHQFDDSSRGFSYRQDADLDMRMDQENDNMKTAAEIVNSYSSTELEQVFSKYGEEKFSRRIAERIVEVREESPIERTKDLEDLIFHCYPKKFRFGKTHPATRCFQALRIEVNNELGVIEETLPKVFEKLDEDGLICAISFHSLEDRIVKHYFKSERERAIILTKKPVLPTQEEINENIRSRSAKLRVIKKNSEGTKWQKRRKNRKAQL